MNIWALRRLEHDRNLEFLQAAAGLSAVHGTLLQSLTRTSIRFKFTLPLNITRGTAELSETKPKAKP